MFNEGKSAIKGKTMLRSANAQKKPLRCRLRALRGNNEGATAIEFAMVAPVLFTLIFGIIEFGLMLSTQSALDGAASNAARVYKAKARSTIDGADCDAIHFLMTQYGGGLIDPSRLRISAVQLAKWGDAKMPHDIKKNEGYAGRTGQITHYRIKYDYSTYTPFLAELFGGKRKVVTLWASTVVQNEPSVGGPGGY